MYPSGYGVINVKAAPYGARGDGRTDDTAAIQSALNAAKRNSIVYFPNGTYIVDRQLVYRADRNGNRGNTIMEGQTRDGVVIRLADASPGFQDPKAPRGVVFTGSEPAQAFRGAIRNLTIHTGSRNPGANGLQFYANNQGVLRDVTIRSGDGGGPYGIDFGYTIDAGPLLVKSVRIEGFDTAIYSYRTAGIVVEDLTIQGQRKYGILNAYSVITIRGLTSSNAVPAVYNKDNSGVVTLLDARLDGVGDASKQAAVLSDARAYTFVRNLQSSGYRFSAKFGDRGLTDNSVTLAASHPFNTLFGSVNAGVLGLPINATPDVPLDDPRDWADVTKFGAVSANNKDTTAAFQAAIDSGKTTVFVPNGQYRIDGKVVLRGAVRRFVGGEAILDGDGSLEFGSGKSATGRVERLELRLTGKKTDNVTIRHASSRTLVLANLWFMPPAMGYDNTGSGDLYIEDVCMDPVRIKGQKVWARQFNVERKGTHILNDGGTLWILGLKTENSGTIIETKGGGKTELYGAQICSSCGAGNHEPRDNQPMFVVTNGQLGLYGIGERNTHSYDNKYVQLVRETRGGVTRTLDRSKVNQRASGGSAIVGFVGY